MLHVTTMNVVEDISKLAATERDVRRLEMLIEYVGSLSDEELARAWPRIIKIRRTLKLHAMCPSVTADAPAPPNGDREAVARLMERLCRILTATSR
jgi:hypothetical protein